MSCFQIRNFVTSNNRARNIYLPLRVVSCFQIRNFVISNNPLWKAYSWTCVVSCFQIRNFVTSNNMERLPIRWIMVVSCFQIRNFVTSNNILLPIPGIDIVVSCFQIRNFVTSNNLNLLKRLIVCRLLQKFKKKKPSILFYFGNKKEGFLFSKNLEKSELDTIFRRIFFWLTIEDLYSFKLLVGDSQYSYFSIRR